MKLFRVTVSTNRTEYVVTNDLTQQSTSDVKNVCSQRWQIVERSASRRVEVHRGLKQLTGLESCQCRHARIQRNHIACAILVWNYLKKLAYLTQKTIYQLKTELLSGYLAQELKFPSVRMQLV